MQSFCFYKGPGARVQLQGGGLGLVGRYGEVKSVYLCKFKSRVHHTCHHNVIVYQQGAAQLRSESIVCGPVSTSTTHAYAYTGSGTPPLHTAARDQYKSKYSAHTPAPTPDGNAQTHNHNHNHLRAAPRATAVPPPVYHHTSRHCPNAHASAQVHCSLHASAHARCLID